MTTQENIPVQDKSFENYVKVQTYIVHFIDTMYRSFGFKLVPSDSRTDDGNIAIEFTIVNTEPACAGLTSCVTPSFVSDLNSSLSFFPSYDENEPTRRQLELKLDDTVSYDDGFAFILQCANFASEDLMVAMTKPKSVDVNAGIVKDSNPGDYLKQVKRVQEASTTTHYEIIFMDGTRGRVDVPEGYTIAIKEGGFLHHQVGKQIHYFEKESVH